MPAADLTQNATIFFMRITVDIDDPILGEVRALQAKDGRPLGAVMSALLADALARRCAVGERSDFHWISRPMQALVDLDDKDALHAALAAARP